MNMASAAPLIVPALKKHTATVIWAHGLGDSGAGWYGRSPFIATTLHADDPTGCQLQRTLEDEADSVNVPLSSLMLQIYP